jgi:hypothetical protein
MGQQAGLQERPFYEFRLFPVDLPAGALKLAWWQVSCLQAVNGRFQSGAITGPGKSGMAPFHPTGPILGPHLKVGLGTIPAFRARRRRCLRARRLFGTYNNACSAPHP